MPVPLYDVFSADYDRFVDWPSRLAYELPFIEEQLAAGGARRLLDAACGTGAHAIALAQQSYTVVGADLSAGMIERAQQNASAADSTEWPLGWAGVRSPCHFARKGNHGATRGYTPLF